MSIHLKIRKMARYLFGLLFSTTIYYSTLAQWSKPFRVVELPDSITTQLKNYLEIKEKLSSNEIGGIYVYNLQNSKDLKYHDGIFSFRPIGPHFHRRIFIIYDTKIKIFDSSYVDDLLQEFNFFIRQINLPAKKKIEYLKAISIFLEKEYATETSSIQFLPQRILLCYS